MDQIKFLNAPSEVVVASVVGAVGGMMLSDRPAPVKATIGIATSLSVLMLGSFFLAKDHRVTHEKKIRRAHSSYGGTQLLPEKLVSGQQLRVQDMGTFARVTLDNNAVIDTDFTTIDRIRRRTNAVVN